MHKRFEPVLPVSAVMAPSLLLLWGIVAPSTSPDTQCNTNAPSCCKVRTMQVLNMTGEPAQVYNLGVLGLMQHIDVCEKVRGACREQTPL